MGGFGVKSCDTGDERMRIPDAVPRVLARFGTCSPGHVHRSVCEYRMHSLLLSLLHCSSQCEARMSGCLQQSDVSPPSTVPSHCWEVGGRALFPQEALKSFSASFSCQSQGMWILELEALRMSSPPMFLRGETNLAPGPELEPLPPGP